MSELAQEVTAEEAARHYTACMDSVNLITAGQPEGMDDQEWQDTVARNKEHLAIMVAKDFMQDQDLAPLKAVL